MALPIRNLPLVQNWDCQSCGDCCRELEAVITDEEKHRIEAMDLADDPEIGRGPWFKRHGWRSTRWSIRHRPEGGCVFLTAGNHCRLHELFGAEVKPFACRLFPFLLIPAGNHWRVGMRFSCPTVSANVGRPSGDYAGDLTKLSLLLEKHEGRSADSAAPPLLQAGQHVSWPDFRRFVSSLSALVGNRGERLEQRLRKCLALARICRQAQFDSVSGDRLDEFLQLVNAGLEGEVPDNPRELPAPGWIGRVLFRALLAVFARKDRGNDRGPAARSRLSRLNSGWRFIRGRGRVPRVNGFLNEITFADVETRETPAAIDAILERYFLTKLHSLQFCGPANFGMPLWEGLQALILTFPAITWLTRAFAHMPGETAVQKAMTLVDNHFGGNPVLGASHNRFFVRTLAQRGELDRLVAWYSR